MLFCEQIRAARSLLGWNQSVLAQQAELGIATVRRLELLDGPARGNVETLWKIQAALENAGIEFIPGDKEKGPGVRLSKPYDAAPKHSQGGD